MRFVMRLGALAGLGLGTLVVLSPGAGAAEKPPQPPVPVSAASEASEGEGTVGSATSPEAAVLKWKASPGVTYLSTPATGKNGTVVFGTNYGIDIRRASTGARVCRYPAVGVAGQVTTTPAVDLPNNTVFFGTENGLIVSINATTCALKTSSPKGMGRALVAYQNGLLVSSFPQVSSVRGFDPATLAQVWSYGYSVPNAQEPRFLTNGIVLVANSPWIDAIDASTGLALWWTNLGTPLVGRAAAPGDGFVYVSGLNGVVYQFNVFNGTPGWTKALGTPTQLVGNKALNRIIATGQNGRLYSLSTSTGAVNCFVITAGSFSARAAVDYQTNTVYAVNSGNGKLYKVSPSCNVQWQTTTGAYAGSSPHFIGAQSAVFVGGNGYAWAFVK